MGRKKYNKDPFVAKFGPIGKIRDRVIPGEDLHEVSKVVIEKVGIQFPGLNTKECIEYIESLKINYKTNRN
jgi:hypothetical protein